MVKERRVKHGVHKGSLLLELLIAFAIISVAMTVVVDAFVTSQKNQATLSEQTDLVKAITMLFEDMSREARVSAEYACATGTPSPCGPTDEFLMTHIEGVNNQGSGEEVSYTLDTTTGRMQKRSISGPYLDITPPSIEVLTFSVEMFGDAYSNEQVRALVTLSARDRADPTVTINMQTSFTMRNY